MKELANFYVFSPLEDPAAAGAQWKERAGELDLRGTFILAREGANIALGGEPERLDEFIAWFGQSVSLDGVQIKRTSVEKIPFGRLVVKVKPEIVTFGQEVTHALNEGRYISPEDFHRMANDPDVVLLDVRNDYECIIGTFEGAMTLPLKKFRDLPEHLDELRALGDKKIISFCTGGVRCEKAVPYLRDQGLENVYELEGGILNYLREYPEGHWRGECFVFDERYSVKTDGSPGSYEPCGACGQPSRDGECLYCGARNPASAVST